MKNQIIDFKFKKATQMFDILPNASLTLLFVITKQHWWNVRLYMNAFAIDALHIQKL